MQIHAPLLQHLMHSGTQSITYLAKQKESLKITLFGLISFVSVSTDVWDLDDRLGRW